MTRDELAELKGEEEGGGGRSKNHRVGCCIPVISPVDLLICRRQPDTSQLIPAHRHAVYIPRVFLFGMTWSLLKKEMKTKVEMDSSPFHYPVIKQIQIV